MKFFQATTTAPLELSSIFGEGKHVFPVGTVVSATEVSSGRHHLNATHNGETFDGYAASDQLEIGELLATINEG